MIKRTPNLSSSQDWQEGYWLGIATGGIAGFCGGLLLALWIAGIQ